MGWPITMTEEGNLPGFLLFCNLGARKSEIVKSIEDSSVYNISLVKNVA
jgi:hypothetical protein